MKIAILSPFYPYRGGIAQSSAAIYRVLEQSHEVRAINFTRQYPGLLFPGKTQFVSEHDRADRIPSQRVLDSINPLSYLSCAGAILRLTPDLLIIRFWMPFFAPALGTVAARVRRGGVRIISILDNVVPHERRPGDASLTRFFLKRNDAFVVMSKTVAADLERLHPPAKYILHPHPIYSHFGERMDRRVARQKLGIPVEKKVLLFFGFIRDYKGLDRAIAVMRHLPDDYLLLVAGESYGDFARYYRLIEETGTVNKIMLFNRYIDDAEVPAFFSAANVCLLPYKSATQSGILQIAFNFNTPAIVTDVGGLSETVQDGTTGFVVADASPHALAQSVKTFFDNECEPAFMQAIEQRKKTLSWESFAHAILRLHHEISRQENKRIRGIVVSRSG